MKLFIGTKFYEHDSAAYIINPQDKDIFAMSTERITRYKHDYLYPVTVIEKYIERKKLDRMSITEVFIGLPFKSNSKNLVSSHLNIKENLLRDVFDVKYIKDVQNFKKTFQVLPYILALGKLKGWKFLFARLSKNLKLNKLHTIEEEAVQTMQKIFPNAKIIIKSFDHAYCHAISSYYKSGFNDATLITMDGYGDGVFSRAYVAKNGKLSLLSTSTYNTVKIGSSNIGSIGEIYSYFTTLLGFQAQADEGKVEALAAYGNHDNELYYKLMETVTLNKKTHSLELNHNKCFELLQAEVVAKYIDKFSKEDVSAAVQKYLEDVTIPYYKDIVALSGITNVCLSGGVAANVIMNLNIFENVTKNLHVTPAMGDEGSSEGAAILMMQEDGFLSKDLEWIKKHKMPYLGSEYTNEEISKVLDDVTDKVKYEFLGTDWHERVSGLVVEKKIGALFQGRMEWGPRSLGNRSIIAVTNDKDIRTKINKEIKKRPLFQPFCPSILIEEKDRLFIEAYNNKHMTCAFRLKEEFYEDIPSSIHVDGTARVQFVSEEDNPSYHKLLLKIKEKTGFGILINTSFNKHGRTIVETPSDAIEDFLDTDLDYMMIGEYLVTRIID